MSSSKKENNTIIDLGLTLTSTDINTLMKQAEKTKLNEILLKNSIKSGNDAIDDLIVSTQLNANNNNASYFLEWINFDRFEDIKQIGQGGFSTIYSAKWVDKKINSSNSNDTERSSPIIIALKSLHNSKDVKSDFFQEVNIII